MSNEAVISARPALPSGRAGGDRAFWLEAMPEGHVLHVLARLDATGVERRLWAIVEDKTCGVRPYGPSQWFVVGDSALSPAALREKMMLLDPGTALSDQTHGRVRLAIWGPRSRAALAAGCSVDFSERAFPIGSAAATLFNRIGVHVARTGETRFEVIVLRSFARDLWEILAGVADALET